MADDLYPVPEDIGMGATIRGFVAGQKLARRYKLNRMLGRGGMGVVWLAQDEELERDVAIKFLPEMLTLDKEAISDLKRETRRSLELTHPNIVRIYDFVQDTNWAGISMEYVDGDTLSALKVEQPGGCYDAETLVPWLKQLCDALIYAHEEARVVHRDLKPANLMMDLRSRLKVADFGIARSVSDSVSRVTMARSTGGTLVYMSPQQAMGEPASVTDDVYALGATLYDLLTGKPPFFTGNVMMQLREKTPQGLAARRAQFQVQGKAEIPEVWEQTILACLAKEAADRPQSVAQVGEWLGVRAPSGSFAGPPTVPVPVVELPPPEPAPPEPLLQPEPPRRSGGGGWIILILILLALGGAGYYFGVMLPAQKAAMAQNQQTVTPPTPQPAPSPVPSPVPVAGQPWTNSLGMKFVPAGTDGVLFSIWDARVKDYAAFVKDTNRTWTKPDFTQTDDDPEVDVSWNDSQAFAQWLTKKEQGEGKLKADQEYRLPTDAEWSKAAGLDESNEGTPKDKDEKIKGVYPWGSQWPPPDGAGNYAESLTHDGFAYTSPVGSFKANNYGLFDMGGDVLQWCDDKYDDQHDYRVLRGSSWADLNSNGLLSSYRDYDDPGFSFDIRGFRLVLVATH